MLSKWSRQIASFVVVCISARSQSLRTKHGVTCVSVGNRVNAIATIDIAVINYKRYFIIIRD